MLRGLLRRSGRNSAADNHEVLDQLVEHERELFKIEDGRLAAMDTQATAVIAAAIATAAFLYAARASADRPHWVSVVVLALSTLTVLLALQARRDVPRDRSRTGRDLKADVKQADIRVEGLTGRADVVQVGEALHAAWQSRQKSAGHRRSLKRKWLSGASFVLVVEFLVAVVGPLL